MSQSHENYQQRSLDWLLSLDKEEFIYNAFKVILGRLPDNTGVEHYLKVLSRKNNKIQILSDLFNSVEASRRRQRSDICQAVFRYKHPVRWFVVSVFGSGKYSCSENDTEGSFDDTDGRSSHQLAVAMHNEHNGAVLETVNRIQDQLLQLEYRLDRTDEIEKSDVLGKGEARYLFNLSTSNQWRRHAVGIVRVERELAAYLRRFRNVEFVLWDRNSASLRRLEQGQVNRILSDSWCDSAGLPSYSSARLAKLTIGTNDVYISVGLDWDNAPTDEVLQYLAQFEAAAVLACHDTVPIQFPEFLAREEIAQEFRQHLIEMAHGSTKVWAASQASKRDLVRFWESAQLECDLPEICTVPLASYASASGLPALNKHDEAIMRDVFRKGEYVLYVSSLEPRKNHRLMLNIWRDLWAERGAECPQFVQVGMVGWGSEELLGRIPRMAVYIGGKINSLHHIGDDLLAHLYHHCAFTVFPSLYEGWGLAATEALGFGKVCVVANNSSLVEATQGLMPSYHPLDFIGWKAEIEKLLDDLPYRQALEECISSNYKVFTWDDFSRSFCDNLLVRQ